MYPIAHFAVIAWAKMYLYVSTTIIVHVSKSSPTMIAGPTHLVVKASSDNNIRAERLV